MKKIIFIILLFCLITPIFSKGEGYKLRVSAISYCLRGRTACGTVPQVGTVSVDPRIIPLHSRLYIPGYGWGKALDTGGNIKGKVIDVWLPSRGECLSWGRKSLTITVIPPGN